MAKRFGRNQRRKLLAKIATLEEELSATQYGPFCRARPFVQTFEDIGSHILDHDTTEHVDQYGQFRKTARVRLFITDRKRFSYVYMYRSIVAWRGIEWNLDAVDFDAHFGFRPEGVVEVDLEAIGSRSCRRQYQ